MRLIHCADLHLDSAMTRHLNPEAARSRRAELLNTYLRMVDYAEENEVDAILIAGDLFDTRNIPAGTRKTVMNSIRCHPDILFFYLKGNHDNNNFLAAGDTLPDNLKTFSDHWMAYRMDSVVIHGIERTPSNAGSMYHELQPLREDFNIVLLHGQITSHTTKDAESLSLSALKNRNIDYLALGHVHQHQLDSLDARGIYCYPGCLEGRGYDECGLHGFMLLDIDEEQHSLSHSFIPFAGRTIYSVSVDVSGVLSSSDLIRRAEQAAGIVGCTSEDLVEFVLIGELDIETDLCPEILQVHFREEFYHVRITDNSRLRIDPQRYILDESLKGEFVRTILADPTIDDRDKTAVIRYGLQAIAGEDFSL